MISRHTRRRALRVPSDGWLPSEVQTMRTPLVLLLLVFWMFLAFRALQRGDTTMAIILVVVGISLTAYRLRRG